MSLPRARQGASGGSDLFLAGVRGPWRRGEGGSEGNHTPLAPSQTLGSCPPEDTYGHQSGQAPGLRAGKCGHIIPSSPGLQNNNRSPSLLRKTGVLTSRYALHPRTPRGRPLGLPRPAGGASPPPPTRPAGRGEQQIRCTVVRCDLQVVPGCEAGRAEAAVAATQRDRAQRSPSPAAPTRPEPRQQALLKREGGEEEEEKEEEGRERAAPKSLAKRTTALSAESLLPSSTHVHRVGVQHRAGAQSRPSARVPLGRGQRGTPATVLDAG